MAAPLKPRRDFLDAQALANHVPEIVLCQGDWFTGAQLRTNVGQIFHQDDGWNDNIRSVIVVSGIWDLWSDRDEKGTHLSLGVGYYEAAKLPGIAGQLTQFQMRAW